MYDGRVNIKRRAASTFRHGQRVYLGLSAIVFVASWVLKQLYEIHSRTSDIESNVQDIAEVLTKKPKLIDIVINPENTDGNALKTTLSTESVTDDWSFQQKCLVGGLCVLTIASVCLVWYIYSGDYHNLAESMRSPAKVDANQLHPGEEDKAASLFHEIAVDKPDSQTPQIIRHHSLQINSAFHGSMSTATIDEMEEYLVKVHHETDTSKVKQTTGGANDSTNSYSIIEMINRIDTESFHKSNDSLIKELEDTPMTPIETTQIDKVEVDPEFLALEQELKGDTSVIQNQNNTNND